MSIYEIPNGNAGGPAENEEKRLGLEKKKMAERKIALAKELIESGERLAFPGINPHSYADAKAVEAEFPGYFTPIDELAHRLKNEGMKVVLESNSEENGDVFILPFGSENTEDDGVLPKILDIVEGMNEKLRELILLGRN